MVQILALEEVSSLQVEIAEGLSVTLGYPVIGKYFLIILFIKVNLTTVSLFSYSL